MVNFLKGSKTDAVTDEHHEKNQSALVGEDGGLVDRARLEKRLKRKLDLRFSILIVIYILNCKAKLAAKQDGLRAHLRSSQTSTATTSPPLGLKASRRI